MKVVKNTIAVAVVGGILAILALGVEARIQKVVNKSDTVGSNKTSIDELKILIDKNIEEDKNVHPQINVLQEQIKSLNEKIAELSHRIEESNRRSAESNKKIDELTNVLIRYLQKYPN